MRAIDWKEGLQWRLTSFFFKEIHFTKQLHPWPLGSWVWFLSVCVGDSDIVLFNGKQKSHNNVKVSLCFSVANPF